jgi:hypothetical protein
LLCKLDATTNKQKKNHVFLELSLVQIQSLVFTGQNNGTILGLFLQIKSGRSSSQALYISFTIGPQRFSPHHGACISLLARDMKRAIALEGNFFVCRP